MIAAVLGVKYVGKCSSYILRIEVLRPLVLLCQRRYTPSSIRSYFPILNQLNKEGNSKYMGLAQLEGGFCALSLTRCSFQMGFKNWW